MASIPSSPHLYPMNLEHALLIATYPLADSVEIATQLEEVTEVVGNKCGLPDTPRS